MSLNLAKMSLRAFGGPASNVADMSLRDVQEHARSALRTKKSASSTRRDVSRPRRSTLAAFLPLFALQHAGSYLDSYYARHFPRPGTWTRTSLTRLRLDAHDELEVSRRDDWGWRLASVHVLKESCDVGLFHRELWKERASWYQPPPPDEAGAN